MTNFLKKYKFIILTILVLLILLNYKYLFNQKEEVQEEFENNQEDAKNFENEINNELQSVLKEINKQNSSDIINNVNVPSEDKMDKLDKIANEFEEKRDEKLANDILNNSSLSNGNSSINPCKNNCW